MISMYKLTSGVYYSLMQHLWDIPPNLMQPSSQKTDLLQPDGHLPQTHNPPLLFPNKWQILVSDAKSKIMCLFYKITFIKYLGYKN